MISELVYKMLKEFVPEENIFLNEPMAGHTTFRTGGCAAGFIEIETCEQIQIIQKYLRKLEFPYLVMGNGSNLLYSDKGYKGIVLHINDKMNQIRVEGNKIIAQAGAFNSQIANIAYEHALTGFEFASGIPGTIGGGVVMNAGAYDGEMKQVVRNVLVVDKEGDLLNFDNETMEFGYRSSVIKKHPFTVVEVTIELENGDRNVIQNKMKDLSEKRRLKQPLEYPSAGSTFKRPEGYFAGELIMNAGLKGYQIGGARVSDKHCGFVINTGEATASDIQALIKHIQHEVKEQSGVDLEPEIVLVGS